MKKDISLFFFEKLMLRAHWKRRRGDGKKCNECTLQLFLQLFLLISLRTWIFCERCLEKSRHIQSRFRISHENTKATRGGECEIIKFCGLQLSKHSRTAERLHSTSALHINSPSSRPKIEISEMGFRKNAEKTRRGNIKMFLCFRHSNR